MSQTNQETTGEGQAPVYQPGKPTQPYDWRSKLRDRGEMIRYLQTAERYWYGQEGYGSERRRTPA